MIRSFSWGKLLPPNPLSLMSAFAWLLVACSSTSLVKGSGAPDGGSSGANAGSQCTAARKTHLTPVAKVSTGEVKVVKTEGDVRTIYINASAGGTNEARANPRVYI